MAIKTTFEPKDPRIAFEEEYNSDDGGVNDWASDEKPRKRKTGTQALVEFLNTTSPEEFQKDSPKRSSALFFRRRKSANSSNNKSTSSMESPVLGSALIHRKNYIEIIANPSLFNRSKSPNSAASINSSATGIGSQLNRTLSNSTSIYPNASPTLPLPTRKGISNKDINHSNSLYNATSGRSQSTTTQTSRLPPGLTKSGFVRRQPSLRADATKLMCFNERKSSPISILPILSNDVDLDIIEGGLKQRLNHYQNLQMDKPSDCISKSIAKEHTAALRVLFSLANDQQQQQKEDLNEIQSKQNKKRRPRHIQVQTMPYEDNQELDIREDEDVGKERHQQLQLLDHEITKQRLEKVEKELRQEKLINSRLEAALEETRDHYEVLSGLAYKKLREVWEEKVRWENACIETKERCWHDHQQLILGNIEDSQSGICPSLGMEFLLEEEHEVEYEEEEEENLIS